VPFGPCRGRAGGLSMRLAARVSALPIRTKLLALVLVPLVVVLPMLGLILAVWGNAALDRMLITKVRADLAVAHGYFDQVLVEVAAGTRAMAESQALHQALARGARPDEMRRLLRGFADRERLDVALLRGDDGRLLASSDEASDGELPALPTAPAGDRVRASVQVLGPGHQAMLPSRLRQRVAVPLLPTRNARPADRAQEDRAMMVLADAPVAAADGRSLGRIQAGVLLNRNLAFIDHINAIVYPEGSLPFGSRGTATLFLDDVRISTNVRLFANAPPETPAVAAEAAAPEERAAREARAIGTRVSQSVRAAVLDEGRTWLDRAFVVSDWYVSGYEPITDGAGQRVGMLYVGYLEQPFTWIKYGVLGGIGVVFFGVMIAAAFVSARWARRISHPIERMTDTMRQVESGSLQARVGLLAGGDELGALAAHLDHLLDTIAENARALQRWNAELDAKVAERTQALEAAQQQLVHSEKMAAIGQLTASIAHEVNNPIAVIQGNLDLARELLGAQAAAVDTELTLIDQQVERMRLIVNQLLQFARPNEFAGYVEAVDCARLLEDCLVLVGHLMVKTHIEVRRDFAATRRPSINRGELQQVLVNLMVNAIHAMPEGGVLALATRDATGGAVEVSVADTGPGLPPELIGELFKPFVTRKKDGTGLGLWISRSIIERYGGDIVAGNQVTGGALMTLVLPTEPTLGH